MADIFISYAREDLESARRLAGALEERGWPVFWDRTIPPGKTWREVISAALQDARCVIVLWSSHSVNSHWVLEEADSGLERNILVPAFIEAVKVPLGYGSIQAADLSQWDGVLTDSSVTAFFGEVATRLELPRKAPQKDAHQAETKREPDGERRNLAAENRRPDEERGETKAVEAKRKVEETERQNAAADQAGATPVLRGITPRDRVIGALSGAVIGYVFGVIVVLVDWPEKWFFGGLLPGAGCGIAGAISGMHLRIIVAAAIGAAIGWVVMLFLFRAESHITTSLVFGVPVGVIVGAVVGVILEKRRSQV